MWTSAELKMRAKGAFQKNYWSAVLVGFVMAIFGGSAGMAAGRASGYSNAYEEYQYYWGGGDSLAFAAAMMIVAAVAGIIGLIFFFLDICGKCIENRGMPLLYHEPDRESFSRNARIWIQIGKLREIGCDYVFKTIV